jgi:DNA transformation protein
MAEPISSIPNLGPASEAAFARAGITSAEEIRALGADEAYMSLLLSGSQPHFIGYYVLVMGLQGRPWNDCKGDEKKALRARFDKLKAKAAQSDGSKRSAFEAALDALGVIERPAIQPTK